MVLNNIGGYYSEPSRAILDVYTPKAYNNYIWSQELIPWSYVQKIFYSKREKIKPNCSTMGNPQSEFMLEWTNQFIANLVHIFDSQNNYLDEDEPWKCIITDTDFYLQSMYHTTLQAKKLQLVSEHDMIQNTPHIYY